MAEIGNELHRLLPMGSYDQGLFLRIYDKTKPLMRKLSRQVDTRRVNVTTEDIYTYFEDKFIFVFTKYHSLYDEPHLRYVIVRSLMTYKNKLVSQLYGGKSGFNQGLTSLEVLFDNNKELLDDYDEVVEKEVRLSQMREEYRKRLTPTEYLILELTLDPPPFFKKGYRSGRLYSTELLAFLDIPRNKRSLKDLVLVYKNIDNATESIKKEGSIL